MSTPETPMPTPAPPTSRRQGVFAGLVGRLATPLTTGFFAVSTISGVALFFHWLPGTFHTMHVWLSMVLLVPFAFHLWKNYRSLVGYARRGTLVLPLAAVVAVALPFAAPGLSSGGQGGNPAFRTIPLMTAARLADLAPVLRTTPDALVAALKGRGYQVRSADDTLNDVATASGKQASAALFAVMPAR